VDWTQGRRLVPACVARSEGGGEEQGKQSKEREEEEEERGERGGSGFHA